MDDDFSVPDPRTPKIITESSTKKEMHLIELKKIKSSIADLPNFEKRLFTLANGDYPFRKEKLWGE
ncbi:MAG: hypothetical protein ACI9XO_002485 [Paraglaciecola sp.]|jgi:hypothetical protein